MRVFVTWEQARAHICDHLLTHPECRAWAVVLADEGCPVDLRDADLRWKTARALFDGEGQELYDLYVCEIGLAADSARKLGWHASCEKKEKGKEISVALGLQGLLLVVDGDTLLSAFLGGQGVASRTTEERPTRGNPLPREGSGPVAEPTQEARARARRAKRWGPEETLFYEVFRPAVQFVRRQTYDSFDLTGQPLSRHSSRDYWRLRAVLPRMSQLKLEGWKEYCRQCHR
jgi:hypothetical protein